MMPVGEVIVTVGMLLLVLAVPLALYSRDRQQPPVDNEYDQAHMENRAEGDERAVYTVLYVALGVLMIGVLFSILADILERI